MKRTLPITAVTALLMLSACSSPLNSGGNTEVHAARQSIFYTLQLTPQSLGTLAGTRPGALLGTYIAEYLAKTSGSQVNGAKNGVDAVLSILLENTQTNDDSFALLQALGTVLQVNVQDTLNRSADRKEALDAYTDTLANLLAQSKTTLQVLTQQEATLRKTSSTQQQAVSTIQRDLNTALNKQDYSTASAKQQQIIEAQTQLTKTQSQDKQLVSNISLFKKLNTVADQRLAAIKANREILIAGLHVVDVPGINDIGVLNQSSKGFGGLNSNIFDPGH